VALAAPVTAVLAAGFGACKGTEHRPPRTVVVATEKEVINEISVHIDFKTHTWGPFEVRRAVPFDGFWQRYEPFVGIPISEIVLAHPPRPSSTIRRAELYDFKQVHGGYPVAGYGYSIQVLDGYVLSGLGKAMTGLPDKFPTPIPSERALAIALEQVEPKGARPWLTNPGRWRPPTSELILWSRKVDPIGADFRLVYYVAFSMTGVSEPGTLTIDAETGAVIERSPGSED
jgi:hypothetical protein